MADSDEKHHRKKADQWSYQESGTLISLWQTEDVQKGLRETSRNRSVWATVASSMKKHGYSRTYFQCKNKVGALVAKYLKAKDAMALPGAVAVTSPHFDDIDKVLGNRSLTRPPCIIDSSAIALAEAVVDPQSTPETTSSDDTKFLLLGKGSDDHVPSCPQSPASFTEELSHGESDIDEESSSNVLPAPNVTGSTKRIRKRKSSSSVSEMLEYLRKTEGNKEKLLEQIMASFEKQESERKWQEDKREQLRRLDEQYAEAETREWFSAEFEKQRKHDMEMLKLILSENKK